MNMRRELTIKYQMYRDMSLIRALSWDGSKEYSKHFKMKLKDQFRSETNTKILKKYRNYMHLGHWN